MLFMREIVEFRRSRRGSGAPEGTAPRLHSIEALEAAKIRKGTRARVVWTEGDDVILFELQEKRTQFWRASQSLLRQWLLDEVIEQKPDNLYDTKLHPGEAKGSAIERRDRAYEAIKPLLDLTPAIFDRKFRAQEVVKRASELGRSPRTVQVWLRRFWMHGMTANALIPSYHNCGNPGERRNPRNSPLGRKPESDEVERAAPITAKTLKTFETMTNRYYRKVERGSLRRTYFRIRRELEFQAPHDEELCALVENVPEFEGRLPVPTFRQYRYWYERSRRRQSDEAARLGATAYAKAHRPILGSASVSLAGVGSRFEVDATKLDCYCVAKSNRRKLAGRPTLYLVVDVYSKMIVGMYLGFEEPSWSGACLALRNVVENKVDFCARYGLDISAAEWPVEGLMPARILADRGEFESYDATDFVEMTGVTVENTAPYRGDLKGTVEKRFDMIHSYMRDTIPGMVSKNYVEKGDRDHRKLAKLNIDELTAVIISRIIYLNNYNLLSKHHFHHGMSEAGIQPIPLQMWNWALENGRSELRKVTYQQLDIALLLKKKATSTKEGIKFRGLAFVSLEHRETTPWHYEKTCTVTISYDPENTNQIWRHRGDGSFELCRLAAGYDAFKGKTFAEAQEDLKERRRQAKLAEKSMADAHARMAELDKQLIARAKIQSPTPLLNTAIQESKITGDQELKEEQEVRRAEVDKRRSGYEAHAEI